MPTRTWVVDDPALSEYVFHCMRLLPAEKKKDLNSQELLNFKNEKAMRRFAENESLDKRLLLLSRMGYSYCVVVAPTNENLDDLYKKVTSQYRSAHSRLDIIKAMSEKKIFVLSSRDTLVMSHMAAQNSHSQVYVLDYAYVHLHDKLKSIGGMASRPFVNEARDGMEGLDDLSKIALLALQGDELIQSICGITKFELRILLAMYPERSKMITRDRVSDLMGESKRATGVAKSCGELEKRGYLLREPGYRAGKHRSQVYMIGDKGIDTVLKYLTFLTHKALKD